MAADQLDEPNRHRALSIGTDIEFPATPLPASDILDKMVANQTCHP